MGIIFVQPRKALGQIPGVREALDKQRSLRRRPRQGLKILHMGICCHRVATLLYDMLWITTPEGVRLIWVGEKWLLWGTGQGRRSERSWCPGGEGLCQGRCRTLEWTDYIQFWFGDTN